MKRTSRKQITDHVNEIWADCVKADWPLINSKGTGFKAIVLGGIYSWQFGSAYDIGLIDLKYGRDGKWRVIGRHDHPCKPVGYVRDFYINYYKSFDGLTLWCKDYDELSKVSANSDLLPLAIKLSENRLKLLSERN